MMFQKDVSQIIVDCLVVLQYVLHLCDHYYLLCKIYLAFAVKIMHLVLTAQDAQSKSYIVCAKMK